MGIGLTQYITRIRIEQAQHLLKETDWKIARIAQHVGLNDPRYFNAVFKRHTGITPTEYRENER
jgi:two-component system response regulator YesN